jgi:hypothetical protein
MKGRKVMYVYYITASVTECKQLRRSFLSNGLRYRPRLEYAANDLLNGGIGHGQVLHG